jgi:hypothetical protein
MCLTMVLLGSTSTRYMEQVVELLPILVNYEAFRRILGN